MWKDGLTDMEKLIGTFCECVKMSTIQCSCFLIIKMGISVTGTGHILTAELHYHPMHLISSVLICILEKSEIKKIQKIINNILKIIKVDDTI